MSKFHSTVSRRDFMKALGLGAGAVSAAGVAIPAFKDIDDMIASTPQKTYPWWVKERDYDDITTEVDWDVFHAYDNSPTSTERSQAAPIPGGVMDVYEKNLIQCNDRRAAKRPGFTTRDLALYQIFPSGSSSNIAVAPAPLVGPKWEGTPEDNFITLRAALHWIGSESVGAFALNDKTRRLYNQDTTFNGEIDSTNHTSINLQKDAQWVITYGTHQNYDMKRMELIHADDNEKIAGYPTDLGRAAPYRAYNDALYSEHQFMRFITGMGWYASAAGQGPNPAYGMFAGNGEQSRIGMLMTPHFGLMTRRSISYTTNMPLAPRKPIDFGGTKFCETCRRCAERCPTGGLGDETYTKRNWDFKIGSRPGYKGWRMDWGECRRANTPSYCGHCHGQCPFNHQSDALIHKMVRMTAGTTSLFNKFFGMGDRFMRFAEWQTDESLNAWWYRDLRTYKADTILGGGLYQWAL